MNEQEWQWMGQALELAKRGRGWVEPNPLVGAVVIQGGHVVGAGWHKRFGEAHAEVHALTAAGEAARGATLYVTLEPCCHQGKTPACTEALLRAGIGRVVAAMIDPFPGVAGQGAAQLRSAGVIVDVGTRESEARRLNAPYLKLLATGRPYVHAKWAMTLDGKIATRTGDSKWISGEEARRRVHQLRGRMDGILIGIGTVLADDPELTARPEGPRTACRIVLDSRGRLPATSVLARTAGTIPVLIVTSDSCPEGATEHLVALGCEVIRLPGTNGRVDLLPVLSELGRRRMTNILVEGGSEVLGSFLDAEAIDEIRAFIAPCLAGGDRSKTAMGGVGVAKISEVRRLAEWQFEQVGSDLVIHGRFNLGESRVGGLHPVAARQGEDRG
jgi:diaminohydroxyphosphoribosylaminopyrimidine deaminase/5-amino-6-(5-phosphoribosylamino)uracil reductase